MRFLTKASAVSGIAIAAVMLVSGTAYATASSSPISGTCSDSWYQSATVRETFTANDDIEVYMSTLPTGMEWEILAYPSGTVYAGPTKITAKNTWYTLKTGVPNHFKFNNRFICTGGGGSFSGSEYY
jgi:hypothetical protein